MLELRLTAHLHLMLGLRVVELYLRSLMKWCVTMLHKSTFPMYMSQLYVVTNHCCLLK
jgi:hypothetical protein